MRFQIRHLYWISPALLLHCVCNYMYHTYLPWLFTFFDDDNFWFAAILPLPEELLPGVPQPLPLPYEPVHGGEALRPLLRVQPGVVSCASSKMNKNEQKRTKMNKNEQKCTKMKKMNKNEQKRTKINKM